MVEEESYWWNLCDSHLESLTRWLSCNGEVWGVGPTAVFASAAALFLYHELESTIFVHGDHAQVSSMEKTLVSTMVLGMLALMIHLWVCTMRFFQYYLDTLIRDSPNILLEMTTAGLLGGQEVVPLGPLTKFLKQQQPQIHITVCWFLSLCYADYVRKHYCTRFNMPYLEQWQMELHERATASVHRTMRRVHSFVECAQQRLRGFAQPGSTPNHSETHTPSFLTRVRALLPRGHRWRSAEPQATCPGSRAAANLPQARIVGFVLGSSVNRARQLLTLLKNLEPILKEIYKFILYKLNLEVAVAANVGMNLESLWRYVHKETFELVEWAKCGDSVMSTVPTLLWAVGSAALAHRLISALFRRFVFRRVPLWEIILQNLLFIWMIIYSMHLWFIIVKFIKVLVDYWYEVDVESISTDEEMEGRKLLQQWLIWMCGVMPLASYLETRPRAETPPLMIWITTSPWQRREMGPYGYYLNRPLTSLQSATDVPVRQHVMALRRAFSDSKIVIKEPPKKKRYSKSV